MVGSFLKMYFLGPFPKVCWVGVYSSISKPWMCLCMLSVTLAMFNQPARKQTYFLGVASYFGKIG